MKKIEIPSAFKKEIAKELNTSVQTVHTSLLFFNNSPLARKIRLKAKELLINEANKIDADGN